MPTYAYFHYWHNSSSLFPLLYDWLSASSKINHIVTILFRHNNVSGKYFALGGGAYIEANNSKLHTRSEANKLFIRFSEYLDGNYCKYFETQLGEWSE
jgi:hypothetical protein